MDFFRDFELRDIDAAGLRFRVRSAGSGPPVLLLHGHPHTHAIWYLIAPEIAKTFTVVAPDLRGYGKSEKPPGSEDHEPYSKRAMARDAVALMQSLGFERFSVAGHDRGGRVAYRLALDAPQHVERIAVLDIVPTGEMWANWNADLALADWHWTFLAQPFDFPERLIDSDPLFYYYRRKQYDAYDERMIDDFQAAWSDPQTVHAMCEDYRAGASYDRIADEVDRHKSRRIECPLLALWSGRDDWTSHFDVLATWQEWCEHPVQGQPLDCGHNLQLERPEETRELLERFLNEGSMQR